MLSFYSNYEKDETEENFVKKVVITISPKYIQNRSDLLFEDWVGLGQGDSF